MRIVYLIGSLTNGAGMERVLTTKVNFLSSKEENEVYVVVKERPTSPFFELDPRVHLISLDLVCEADYRLRLTALLMELCADCVVSMYGSEFTFLYKIKDGSRKVVEFHFTRNYLIHLVRSLPTLKHRWAHYLRAYWYQFQQQYYAARYDEIVLLTRRDKALWGDKSNMHFQYNPLSFQSEQKSNCRAKRVIGIGRMVIPKGFHLLIEAFKPIARKYPDWRLDLYGEGHDADLFRKLAADSPQIILHGALTDVQRELLGASILVAPSLYEGFGLTLTEAMECGVPCVAFDCECGPSEIVRHEEDGLLVPVGDVEAMTAAILRLIEDESLRIRYGCYAAENVKRFYVENILG